MRYSLATTILTVSGALLQAQDASCPAGAVDIDCAGAVDEQAVLLLQVTTAENMRGQLEKHVERADVVEKSSRKDAATRLLVPSKEIAPGVHMPMISIGTGGEKREQTYAIVRSWLSIGGVGLDVGAVYGYEQKVSRAMNSVGATRDEVFITSKLPNCENVKAGVFQELDLLQTNYIDLLLLSHPEGNCTDAWLTLEDFHRQGILRSIGISNFEVADMQEILRTAQIKPAVNQILYNVFMHDDEVVNFAKAQNITIEAYSPLGRAGERGDVTRSEVVLSIASHHNVSVYQVALRWIVQQGHTLVFQSTSGEHQEENADVFNFILSDEEMAMLDGLNNPKLMKELNEKMNGTLPGI
mmetsp:Transcript_87909/g.152340  ORF Transcript_87909/g.152340 Transcript_87909/m.152340 type:complete len:355 (+) Transcript_87909:95-1159(+)